jgi:hypothetical protein
MIRNFALPTLILTSVISSPAAFAEFKNTSFSVFGAAGLENVHYQEKIPDFAGHKVESDYSAINFVQRSGGYTAVNDRLGFYITSASTLIAMEKTEDWNASGYNTPIQQDTASLNFNTIDVTMAWHLQNGFFLTAGGHYQKLAFSRFAWKSTSSTEDFADDVENYIRNSPDQMTTITNDVSNGKYDGITTVDEYFAATRFSPETNQDVVFEDASTFGVLFGIGYDSYFMDRSEGIRYRAIAEVGTDVYEHVLNSSDGKAMNNSFGGGIDARIKLGAGYQFSSKLAVLLMTDAHYSHRKAITKYVSGSEVSRPENTFQAQAAYLSISWNFRS